MDYYSENMKAKHLHLDRIGLNLSNNVTELPFYGQRPTWLFCFAESSYYY